MSGLVAIFAPHGTVDRGSLGRALQMLSHRGPDRQRYRMSPDCTVGLGHAYLSTDYHDGTAQPVSDESDSLFAVVDGEISGYLGLRTLLEEAGYRFTTNSSAELVLHLYRAFGASFVGRLRGDCAFVLWDERERLLFAARDRFGIKPLYYANHNGTLYLASEAKALFAAGVPPAWDANSYWSTTAGLCPPPQATLFSGISQLLPGCYLLRTDADQRVIRYWELNYPAASSAEELSDDETSGRIQELLFAAIADRIRPGDMAGCCLSAGVESAGLLGLASHLAGRPLPGYAVSFEEIHHTDQDVPGHTAEWLGSEWYPVAVSRRSAIDVLDEALYSAEGLAVSLQLPAMYLLSGVARGHGTRVLLHADGADELFCSYPHLRHDFFAQLPLGTEEAMAQLPDRRELGSGPDDLLGGILAAQQELLPLDSLHRAIGFVPNFFFTRAYTGHQLRQLFRQYFRSSGGNRDPIAMLLASLPIADQLAEIHPVHRSLYLWIKLSLGCYVLRMLGDGMEMAHSIEGRFPFLDHRLFEYMRTIPIQRLMRGTIDKPLMRKALGHYLPPTVVTRPKIPLSPPTISGGQDRQVKSFIMDTVVSDAAYAQPFFDPPCLEAFARSACDGSPHHQKLCDPALLMVLSTISLHRQFGL